MIDYTILPLQPVLDYEKCRDFFKPKTPVIKRIARKLNLRVINIPLGDHQNVLGSITIKHPKKRGH
jgi:hypothetical protein